MSPSMAGPLRLLPAPSAEPPYDDDPQGVTQVIDGSLALAFPGARASVPLRLVPPAATDGGFGGHPTDPAGLPDPQSWTGRLAQAVAEVLVGARPAGQLARFATLDVLQRLERPSSWGPRRVGRGPIIRPTVASVHVDVPRDGVVEACAVVNTGPRHRVLALRLEGIDGRWQCTALAIG